ncbi:uncharacterized protein LOC144647018 [Oculina patagonica]
MAIKVIFWSCLVAALGYFAYQELTVVTDSISVKMHIPAKRSDVFRLLINPEFVPLKYQPLCVSVSNVTKSQEQDGPKTFQFIMKERVVLIGFFNISKMVAFLVNVTVIEENAIIRNRLNVMGGIVQVTQHWYMTDSKNNNGDETLLEDHFEFTTARLLSRFTKKEASAAHATMMKNIRQHFIDSSQKRNDDMSA